MIYLDNASTSHPKAPGVAAAVSAWIEGGQGSSERGSHAGARAAARLIFEARAAVSSHLGFREASRLVFTKNATEALNMTIFGSARPGSTIATTSLEHNAVIRPLRELERRLGTRTLILPFDERGRPEPSALASALASKPALFVISAGSNVTGAILPVEDIAESCYQQGIPLIVDGSQLVGHASSALAARGISCICFSGHKGLLGPTGTGAACLFPGFDPEPLLFGGTGTRSLEESMPRELPERYEAGTQDHAALAGLKAAMDWHKSSGNAAGARVDRIVEELSFGLSKFPGLRILGPQPGEPRLPLVSFAVEGMSPDILELELDRRGIASRSGFHCAPAAHRSAGTLSLGGALRLSPGPFTTGGDIETTLSALREILS